MSKVLDRLRKKRGTAVQIDGEAYYVRSLTLGELRRLDALPPDDKTGFVVGCALCIDENGEPELPRLPNETDVAWAARVLEELADVPTEHIRALSEGVARIGRTPPAETIVKN